MYGRFRSNDDNTPRRKEFTDESGEIINRRAVTSFILTARVTTYRFSPDPNDLFTAIMRDIVKRTKMKKNVLPEIFASVIECGFLSFCYK